LGIGSIISGMANPFDSTTLLRGQGIFARIVKGGAAAIAASTDDDDREKYNREADKDAKKHPNAITVNSDVGRGLGYHDRLASKSELKDMQSSAQDEVDRHAKNVTDHQSKANDAAKGGGFASKALVAFHEKEAARSAGKLADAQANLKQINDDLNDRFQVSPSRQDRERMAGVSVPTTTGGKVGAQDGHPFYGNQHASGN